MDTITAPVAIPVETVTLPKPSEALRLGMLAVPTQGFQALADMRLTRIGWDQSVGEVGAACAMGSMALAMGENVARLGTRTTWWHPRWKRPEVAYPCGCGGQWPDDVVKVIAHLNDSERWDRGRIAAWLRRIGL